MSFLVPDAVKRSGSERRHATQITTIGTAHEGRSQPIPARENA
jgi:hypothetical protein